MIQQGNNRSACFDTEEDDRFSLDRLTELSHRSAARCTPMR